MSQPFNNGYQGNFNSDFELSIANGDQESSAIDCQGFVLCGIFFPAAFTGTTLTFEISDLLAGTYVPLKNTTSGTSLSYTIAQGTFAAIDPKDFQGVRFLKVKSGSAEGASRTLKCAMRGI